MQFCPCNGPLPRTPDSMLIDCLLFFFFLYFPPLPSFPQSSHCLLGFFLPVYTKVGSIGNIESFSA